MASDLNLVDENINPIFEEIRGLINTSRNRVYIAVNTEMLNLYWNIGKIIMEIQQGIQGIWRECVDFICVFQFRQHCCRN